MNIEQAKAVPILEILACMGHEPVKLGTKEAWFLSPRRNEKHASFKVCLNKNVWYDHGDGIGGDTVALACIYLEQCGHGSSVADALRWIKNMTSNIPLIRTVSVQDFSDKDMNLKIKDVRPIQKQGLVKYVESRGITIPVARKFLKQVHVFNKKSNSTIYALGFKNENHGYELRNRQFKGCVGSKDVTFIRGTTPKPDSVHVFEGFMDFLTIITRQGGKPIEGDTIVMNSISCLHETAALIKDYGYLNAYTWLDNDAAGKKATKALGEFFKTQEALRHQPMNPIYKDSNDVNEWHMKKLQLL